MSRIFAFSLVAVAVVLAGCEASQPKVGSDQARTAATKRLLRQAAVDQIAIGTDHDYVAPLTAFFQERSRRIRH